MNRFDKTFTLTKNKCLLIEGYKSKNIGINSKIRLVADGYDYPGVILYVNFWYSLVFRFYDRRTWNTIMEEKEK